MKTLQLALTAAAVSFMASVASADPISMSSYLSGATSYDGWSNLTSANFPGYPSSANFPGAAPWPSPIGSNNPSSGDATFNKTSGNGYLGSAAVYVGGFSPTPNTSGGAFRVADGSPVAGLETVVLQIEIGEALGFDLFNNAAPRLNYNGGAQNLSPLTPQLVSAVDTGSTFDPGTGPEAIYVNTWLFQWDLSSIVDPIGSFFLDFTAVQHAQIYELQLDQSNVFSLVSLAPAEGTPEPGTLVLLGLGGLGLGVYGLRRRRRGASARVGRAA